MRIAALLCSAFSIAFLLSTQTHAQQAATIQQNQPAANSGPPPTAPSVVYDSLTAFIEHVRADMANWSDTEQKAFLTVLNGATEECRADNGSTDSPQDSYSLMRLCSTAREWPKVSTLANNYLKTDSTYKRAEIYTLLIESYLQTNSTDDVVASSIQMLKTLPYDELVEATANRAIDALLPYHRDQALLVASIQYLNSTAALADPMQSGDLVQGVEHAVTGMRYEQLTREMVGDFKRNDPEAPGMAKSSASNTGQAWATNTPPSSSAWCDQHYQKLSGSGQRSCDAAKARYYAIGEKLTQLIPPDKSSKPLARFLQQPGIAIVIAVPLNSPVTQHLLEDIKLCQPKWAAQHVHATILSDEQTVTSPVLQITAEQLLKLGSYPDPVLLLTDKNGIVTALRTTSDGDIKWTCQQ